MTKGLRKHIEHTDKKKLELLSFISFLFGFSQSILVYVISDYFRESFGSENVSIFYFISYSVALVGILKPFFLSASSAPSAAQALSA